MIIKQRTLFSPASFPITLLIPSPQGGLPFTAHPVLIMFKHLYVESGVSQVIWGENNPSTNAGDTRRGFSPRVRKIPWRWEWLPTSLFLHGKIHGQRSLEGYSPWGLKESDTTEHTHTVENVPVLGSRFLAGDREGYCEFLPQQFQWQYTLITRNANGIVSFS